MNLLSAYEDFTRREGVCLREGNFQKMLQLQGKKQKVAEELSALSGEALDAGERDDFNRRIARLQEQEKEYADLISEKMAANRSEYKQLRQGAVSANKLRRAYSTQAKPAPKPGSLDGRA